MVKAQDISGKGVLLVAKRREERRQWTLTVFLTDRSSTNTASGSGSATRGSEPRVVNWRAGRKVAPSILHYANARFPPVMMPSVRRGLVSRSSRCLRHLSLPAIAFFGSSHAMLTFKA
jgi:hypothetical protein